ncbi:MAG: hypothetical protein ABEH59_01090 [Halobacteriales archaeon]
MTGGTPVTVVYRRGFETPFSAIHGRQADGDGKMALFPTDDAAYRTIPCEGATDSPVPTSRTDGSWTVDWAITTPFEAVGLHEIGAGQRFAVTSAVLAMGPTPCLSPGTYRFTETVPAGVGGRFSMSEPTYPRKLADQLAKRLTITLSDLGTITASAGLDRAPADTESI